MKRHLSILAAPVLLALFLSACTGGGTAAAPAPSSTAPATTAVPPSDESAPGILSSFSATDLEGNELDASIFSDYDLTMVNVWATFCRPCRQEMPDLAELSGEFADQSVRIVGIVSDVLNQDGTINDAQVDTAKDIVDATGADYLHLLPSDDLMPLLSQIYAVPTTLFVDANGNQVGSAYMGAQDKAGWERIINQMLEEVKDA